MDELSAAAHGRAGGAAVGLVELLGALLLAVAWLAIPEAPAGGGLDESWQRLLAHDLWTGKQAGVETVFTYGPLGYLLGLRPYVPELYWLKFAVDVAVKLGAALVLMAAVRRTVGRGARVSCLVFALFLVPVSVRESMWFITIAAGYVLLIADRGRSFVLLIAVACLMSVVALAKFTFLVASAGCFGLLCCSLCRRDSWLRAVRVVAVFCAVFLLAWFAAGQHLGNLPVYVKAGIEIAAGYNEAMTLAGPNSDVLLGLWVLALIALAGAGSLQPPAQQRVAIVLTVAAVLFVSWKAAVVRQDAGHAMTLFAVGATVPFLLPAPQRGRFGRLHLALCVVAAGLGVFGVLRLGDAIGCSPAQYLAIWRQDFAARLHMLASPARCRRASEARLAAVRVQLQLPRIRARVGTATIDCITYAHGLLFLHDFNVHHRPVLQSYSAYTPWLQRRDAEFYAGPAAPEFVLFQLGAADNHVPLAEDSGVYPVLLARYWPVLSEGGNLLLQRRKAAPAPPEPEALSWRKHRLDEWIDLESGHDLQELALHLQWTPLGKLRRALFRVPEVYLDARTASGEVRTMRIAPCMVLEPFVIDPLVTNNADFLQLYVRKQRTRTAAVRVRAQHSGALEENIEVAVRPRAGLAAAATDDERRALLQACYPMLHTVPIRTEPPELGTMALFDDILVLLAPAPSELTFALGDGPHAVSGRYGILRQAFTGEGNTDGVTFQVVHRAADGRETILLDRHLDPRSAGADQSVQRLTVSIVSRAGDVLLLRTLPGRNGDLSRDWSFWTELEIRGG